MSVPLQGRTKARPYAVLIIICALALGLALLNGIFRGHWFKFGIFADTSVCLSMAILFLREKRRLND